MTRAEDVARFSATVKAAVIEERNRIAREIHDTLAQGFAAIRLQLDLARDHPELPPDAVRAIELAHRIAGENLIVARRSMTALRSPQPCLATSLSAAVEKLRKLGQAKVVASLDSTLAPSSEIAHELSRIAQEALLNATRHAEAQSIRVTLTPVQGGGLQFEVADDGVGFDQARATCGLGLVGMRERAEAIGARLAIASELGTGTRVTVIWRPSSDYTRV